MVRSSIYDMVHRYDGVIAASAPKTSNQRDAPGRYDALLRKAEHGAMCLFLGHIPVLYAFNAAKLPFLSIVMHSTAVFFALWIVCGVIIEIGKRLHVVSPKPLYDSKPVGEAEPPKLARETPPIQLKTGEDVALQTIRADETAKTHRLLIKNRGTVTYWFDDGYRGSGDSASAQRQSH